ncbi:MAG: hypothetical protein AB7T63_14050 [Planctomycetota bacterium]
MRTPSMPRVALAALALALVLGGCGSGSKLFQTGGFRASSPTFVLPFTPSLSGESAWLVLANYTDRDADVFATAYKPNAGVAPMGEPFAPGTTFTVPARGSLRTPLGLLMGPSSGPGFLHVDTRDVTTLDPVTGEPTPVDTTGFVIPSIERELIGVFQRGDACQGLIPQEAGVSVGVHGLTSEVQIINTSYSPMVGGVVHEPLHVTVRQLEADGSELLSTVEVLPPLGSLQFAPAITLGQVIVTPLAPVPAGVMPRLSIAAREEGGVVHVAPRFQDTDEVLDEVHDIGWFADWGMDVYGNVHDFSFLLSNPTDDTLTATLRAVQREGSTAILSTPRVLAIAPHRTVLLGTTNVASDGLELGESTPFGDLFGDALAAQGTESVALWLAVPRYLEVSARTFDPAFGSYYTVERGGRRTTNAFASSQPVEPVLGTGRFHDLLLANPTNQDITVPLRVHTPGGTEYILSNIVLPPFQRTTFTLDGSIFREDPNSLVEPPLTRVKVKFSPLSGAFIAARTRRTDANGLLVLVTPRIVDAAD